MAVRQALGVVGAAVGYIYGGPQGARWGWAIGSAIGNTVDPQILRGPSIGDIAEQTSQEGGPRPIVFKRSAPMPGNIIASGPPRTVKKRKSQGKGGPKVETESLYRTYAIGVCEGPIAQFVRVWRNGELVYDAGAPVTYVDTNGQDVENTLRLIRIQLNNETWTQKATYFLGTYDQDPSPDLEVLFGVGTTPAHRGTAYMVVRDDDLTDLRGAIPQYLFQVDQTGSGDFETVYLENDTWEKPANLESIDVAVVAGGQGGASGDRNTGPVAGGEGGGAGGFSLRTYPAVDLPATVDVIVGDGGQGVPADIGPGIFASPLGDPGTDSAFMTTPPLTAQGGGVGSTNQGGEGDEEDGGDGGAAPSSSDGQDGGVSKGGGGGAGGGGLGFGNSPFSGGHGGMGNREADIPALGGVGGIGSELSGIGGQPGEAVEPHFYTGGGGGGGGGGTAASDISEDLIAGPGGGGGFPGGGGGGGGAVRGPDISGRTGAGGDGADGVVVVMHRFPEESLTLQQVVTELCRRAGLPSVLIDVSDLEGFVRGFTVINTYPCTEALRALSQVYFFDAASIDGKVQFFHRGGNSVATIVEAEMLDDEADIEQEKRGDPIGIPRVMNLNYHDIAGGVATDKQTSERAGDRRAVGEAQLQTAVILSADEAAQVVRINHKVMVEDVRGELKFSLSDKFIALTPGDVTIVQWQGRSDRVRLGSVATQDGFQEYIGLRDRQSAYESQVEGIPAAPILIPPSNVVGPTLLELLDIHILRDVDDGVGLSFYVAVAGVGEAWTGALIELSYDGGANYIDSESTSVASTMGELTTALPDHPAEFPDETNTVRVRIDTPDAELDTVELPALLNRANLAIIGDEIIQFGTAVEVTPGEWDLSYLIRARKGTASAAHGTGTRFVLLDAFTPIPASVTDIGRTMTFRATSFGTSPDQGTVVSIVYTGRSQIEREVGYLAAHRDGTDAVLSWQGIGRLGAGATAVHGARFEGYRVSFDDGVLAPVIVDTMNEELIQDVAALGAPLTISVVQLNGLTGAGPTTEVTLA